jgi:Arc/MetJ-type ribon-helix-helix transcriptional regulator
MNQLKAVHTKMSPPMIQAMKEVVFEHNCYTNQSEFVRMAIQEKLIREFPKKANTLTDGDVMTDKGRIS